MNTIETSPLDDSHVQILLDAARHRAFRTIRNRIVLGVCTPGTALRETELAEELGITRSRLREVLALLEQRGLIERQPNRGAVVRRITLDEMHEIFQTREALEGMCARLAAVNVPADHWTDMAALFGEAMALLVRSGEIDTYVENNALLRRRIISAAHNKTLAATLYPLLDQSSLAMRRVVLATNRAEEALEQHREVISALQSGDPNRAERAKRQQIASAWIALKRYHPYIL